MSKYVIKRKIPKYQEAGEVDPVMPGNVVGLQGIGSLLYTSDAADE